MFFSRKKKIGSWTMLFVLVALVTSIIFPAYPPRGEVKAAGTPTVALSVPSQVLVGEEFKFNVTFDNTDTTSTGYGSYINLILPLNGADGNNGLDTGDGIEFIGATYLGQPVQATLLDLPPDYDADGLVGMADNCPNSYNSAQVDNDKDGLGDVCDNCDFDANPDQLDTDKDTVGDICDNCVSVVNTGQINSDGDKFGDSCDICPDNDDNVCDDPDGDKVMGSADNCPAVSNAAQADTDKDGVGDVCDNCAKLANPSQGDQDKDGIGDACDNCVSIHNPGQVDSNNDGIGDACPVKLTSASVSSYPMMSIAAAGDPVCVNHPYAVDKSNKPVKVCALPGSQLVVLRLPFGSVVPDQPLIDIEVITKVRSTADLNYALAIKAQGGFYYGNDAANNPALDPSIVGLETSASTAPVLAQQTITFTPSEELVSGDNFLGKYQVVVDLANGQKMDNFQLTAVLPDNLAYKMLGTVNPSGSATSVEPKTPGAQFAPNNKLTLNWVSVTGTLATNDVTADILVTVPRLKAGGAPVINPTTGGCQNVVLDTNFGGNWTPVDGRDTKVTYASDDTKIDNTFSTCSLGAQKGVKIITDKAPIGYTPGDVVEYSMPYQVSDYYAYDGVAITDKLPDGLLFDNTFKPVISLTEQGKTTTGQMDAANYPVVFDQITGVSTITFNISGELVKRVQDAKILGGCVQTTGGTPDCATSNKAATSGSIIFRAIIQENFTGNYSGNKNVDQGDILANNSTINGNVLDTLTLIGNGSVDQNNGNTDVTIQEGVLEGKSIYAVNGSTTFSTPVKIGAGDEVTYRLKYSLSTGDFDRLSLVDYLPLPLFQAAKVTTFSAVVSGTIPTAGTVKFGPSDTFYNTTQIVPALTQNSANNSFKLDLQSNSQAPEKQVLLDLLVTVSAEDVPFADGLILTNQVDSTETKTDGTITTSQAMAQIVFVGPNIKVTKGAVASSNTNALFSPALTNIPVAFSSDTKCPRFTDALNSDMLATKPIKSGITKIDAGDKVTFAVVLENVGENSKGAFDVKIKDTLPTTLMKPAGGYNLCVTNGAGVAVPYTNIVAADLGDGLFKSGIQLTDPSDKQGALTKYDPTAGTNILIVTYDVEVAVIAEPSAAINNPIKLFNYAALKNGTDYTTEDRIFLATNAIASPVLKLMADKLNATIGEVVEYTVEVIIPEGTSTNVKLNDTFSTGQAYVECTSIAASSADLVLENSDFSTICKNPTVNSVGGVAVFVLGTLKNNDRDNAVTEKIVFKYKAVTLNKSTVVRGGAKLVNAVNWLWTGKNIAATSLPRITVIEPTLELDPVFSASAGDAYDVVKVNLFVSHAVASNIEADEAVLNYAIPTGFTIVENSLKATTSVAPDSTVFNKTNLTVTWSKFLVGTTGMFEFQIKANSDIEPKTIVNNQPKLTWTSLPGNPGQISTHNTLAYERTGNAADPGEKNDYISEPSELFTVHAPKIERKVIGTSLDSTVGNNVAVGEVVTYQVEITEPEGLASNAVIVEKLSTGYAFVECVSLTASSDALVSSIGPLQAICVNPLVPKIEAGRTVSFNLGRFENSDSDNSVAEVLTLIYEVVVTDEEINQSDNNLSGSTEMTWIGNSEVKIDDTAMVVTSPQLVMTNTFAPKTGDAGDIINVNAVIKHGGNSGTSAYDVVFTDNIPTGLVYVKDSVQVASKNGTKYDSVISDEKQLNVIFNSLAKEEEVTVTYQLVGADTLIPGAILTNGLVVTWTSVDGDPGTISTHNEFSTERTGKGLTGGSSVDNYYVTASDIFEVIKPEVSLAVSGTSADFTTGTKVTVGETVDYTFTVSLPEGSINDLVVVQSLPNGLLYIEGSAKVDATGFSGILPTEVVTMPDATHLNISFLNVSVPGTSGTSRQSFTITLKALVKNITGNQAGTSLVSAPALNLNNKTVHVDGSPVTISVIEPSLIIGRDVDDDTPTFEQTLSYTINVSHITISEVDAFEVKVEDTLPAGLIYVSGSATVISGDGWTVDDTNAPTLVFRGNKIFQSDQISLRYVAVVGKDTEVNLGDIFKNPAVVTWTSGTGSNQRTGVDGLNGLNDYYASTDTTTVVTGSDLILEKTADKTELKPGDIFAYHINYSNVGNSTATGVEIHETVPAGTTFNASQSSANWSCQDVTAGSLCLYGYNINILGNGASGSIDFAVNVDRSFDVGVSNISNTAIIFEKEKESDLTIENNTSTLVLPLSGVTPELSVSVVDGVDTVKPGDPILYTITYGNAGSANVVNTKVNVILSNGLAYDVDNSSSGWLCLPDESLKVVNCEFPIGKIDGKTTQELKLGAKVLAVFPGGISGVSADVSIDVAAGEVNLDNNRVTENATITGLNSDLSVTKTDDLGTIDAGTLTTYKIKLECSGNTGASNITITDILPNTVAFISADAGGVHEAGQVVWTVANILPGEVIERNVTVQVSSKISDTISTIVNTAQVTYPNYQTLDSNIVNNTATDSNLIGIHEVVYYVDLSIKNSDNKDVVALGSTNVYTYSYINSGNKDATGVVITTIVPVNTKFNTEKSTANWKCAADGSVGDTCTYEVGALKITESGTVDFAIDINKNSDGSTELLNTAVISDDGTGGDANLANNTATDINSISGVAAGLTLKKDDGVTNITRGDELIYVITVENNGNVDLTGIVLQDQLPADLIYRSSSNGGVYVDSIISWPKFDLKVGDSVVYEVKAGVSENIPAEVLAITNVVTVVDDGTNGVESTAQDVDSLQAGTVDLAVSQVDGKTEVKPGDEITYEITVTNSGNLADSTVTLIDDLSAYTTIISISDDGTVKDQQVTWSRFSLAPGASVKRTLKLKIADSIPTDVTTITNKVTVSDDGKSAVDLNTANNTAEDKNNIVREQSQPQPTTGGGGGIAFIGPANMKVSINNDATCTATSGVRLQLSANNTSKVMVSNYSDFKDSQTFDFQTTLDLPWQLLSGDGDKTVYVKFISTIGGVPATTTDLIKLDSTGRCGLPKEEPKGEEPVTTPCNFDCKSANVEVFIVNPDGTARYMNTQYAKTKMLSDGHYIVNFEDKGGDWNYTDAVIEVDKSNCDRIIFKMLDTKASWHHQIKARFGYNGVWIKEQVLWSDSHVAVGQTKTMFDAFDKKTACNSVNSCVVDLSQIKTEVYIITPQGATRYMNTSYSKVDDLGNGSVLVSFEDKGGDWDYSDVVVEMSRSQASEPEFTLVSIGKSAWHNKVYARIYQNGTWKKDLLLWTDSHIGLDEKIILEKSDFTGICSTDDAGVSEPSIFKCSVQTPLNRTLSYGMKGNDVLAVQNALKCMGYFPESVVANGNFGPTTLQAVKDFQVKYKITSAGKPGYGVVGPATASALMGLK